jgi:TRAP-type C4-dicarboxylate transport system permease small subunit
MTGANMRRVLDLVYKISGGVAALAIVAICLLVTAQVSLNILARIGGPSLSYTIPSYADFAGYFLATASFMALASTLRAGVHIRVNLVIQRFGPGPRWLLEVFTLTLGAVMIGYATWYAAALTAESRHYGDMSTGIIAIPLWMPQSAMVCGLGLLTIALLDTLAECLRAKAPILTDSGSE